MPKTINMSRRTVLLHGAAGGAALGLQPQQMLAAAPKIPPSETIHVAYVGAGTQVLRMLCDLLPRKDVRVVAVCDPNTDSTNYVDWSPNGLRNRMRTCLEDPAWDAGTKGIHAGREVARGLVDAYYRKHGRAAGCAAYADFREMLVEERDIDVVKILTPDHLHATVAIAAMRAGKCAVTHKPVGNRFHETRRAIEVARETGAGSHLLAWNDAPWIADIGALLKSGAIGTLREVHNWLDKPIWPQGSPTLPAAAPVPRGLDWDLWLGPVPHRPYSPGYTNAVFRGWYDFGSGCISDMGHYSLWPVYKMLGLGAPEIIEATPSFTCAISAEGASRKQKNTVSFPHASTIRFRHGALDVFWYDGGMRPPTPDALYAAGEEMPPRGMMFVGDGGLILGDFHGKEARLFRAGKKQPEPVPSSAPVEDTRDTEWIAALREGRRSRGDFLNAQTISETICLGNVALRAGGRIVWDAAQSRITNREDVNAYLTREYRGGWEM